MCTRRWSDQSSACKQDNRLTRARWTAAKDALLMRKEKQWDRGVDADVEGGREDGNKQDDWRQRCKEQVQLRLTSFNQLFEREKWISQ